MPLVKSAQPEVIRSHYLEQQQRASFTTKFDQVIREWFHWIEISPSASNVVQIVADSYLTFVTVFQNKRRLGEEYTYTSIFRQRDYDYDGVPLNQTNRLKLVVLEVVNRNLWWKIVGFLIKLRKVRKLKRKVEGGEERKGQKMGSILGFTLDDSPEIFEIQKHVKYFFLMLYVLKWNPFYNVIETLLGISHIYTYKNTKENKISYTIEGYMLLTVFIIKFVKLTISLVKKKFMKNDQIQDKEKSKIKQPQQNSLQQQSLQKQGTEQLCRICYDAIQFKTATICGHVFCWECIIKTVENNPQCPVCRAGCLPRECVQLRNF